MFPEISSEDDEPIYELLSWDLPGRQPYRIRKSKREQPQQSEVKPQNP